jgi:hypothetical protein
MKDFDVDFEARCLRRVHSIDGDQELLDRCFGELAVADRSGAVDLTASEKCVALLKSVANFDIRRPFSTKHQRFPEDVVEFVRRKIVVPVQDVEIGKSNVHVAHVLVGGSISPYIGWLKKGKKHAREKPHSFRQNSLSRCKENA